MLVNSVVIALGFVGLIWGADKFVFGASALARNAGVSPLLIGLTIVAFGTSAPEIFSSAVSALEDKPELAIGNAFGSNLFNIGVALGVAAILRPLTPPKSLIKKELPALITDAKPPSPPCFLTLPLDDTAVVPRDILGSELARWRALTVAV